MNDRQCQKQSSIIIFISCAEADRQQQDEDSQDVNMINRLITFFAHFVVFSISRSRH